MASWEVTLDDTLAIALGAGVLGTGGGGNTYVGRIWLERELRSSGKTVTIIDADDLTDDALVPGLSGMGAPTVSIEKLFTTDEYSLTVQGIEGHLRKKSDALVIDEIGGSNALIPLVCGLHLGLPVVDGDGMGRAFPELQMDNFVILGMPSSPFALGDVHGNVVIFDPIDSAFRAEAYARILTVQMGGSAALALPILNGEQVKRGIIRGTLSLTKQLGHAVLDARRHHERDAAEACAEIGHGRVLFRGKIVDLRRETTQGFARGHLHLTTFGDPNNRMEIVFQNENLVAWHNGEIVCTVPDLISLLSLDDGEPIGTEMLRYGLRVAVLGMPAPREMKTAAALKIVGPAAFKYDVPFMPIPGDLL